MSQTFLEMITAKKRAEIAQTAARRDTRTLAKEARAARVNTPRHRFRKALSQTGRVNIIAEIKRASPSRGIINDGIDVNSVARGYESGGAAAISVLTEPDHFGGSLDDLRLARAAVTVPLLRKDFIVDACQVYDAARVGADAVLLIVAGLGPSELAELIRIAEDDLGMDALVEVHTKDELRSALTAGATLIGVNNRDLHSLEVSLDVSRSLIAEKPAGTLMIAESGISHRDEILRLRTLGYDGFLIGETLMRSDDPIELVRRLAA
jgi:indole-3-glycerol phosphate synthase